MQVVPALASKAALRGRYLFVGRRFWTKIPAQKEELLQNPSDFAEKTDEADRRQSFFLELPSARFEFIG